MEGKTENEKVKKAKRGRETLIRTAFQNQSNLIRVADNKANMIISINTLIVSSLIAITGYGAVADKLGDYTRWTLLPLVLIMLACLCSVIFAILSARPSITKAKRTQSGTEKSSLLFYGQIARYHQEEYLKEFKTLLNSGEELYEHLAIDLFNQGRILNRKYKLLVYSYQVFMFGFIFGVAVFLGLILWGN